MLLSWLGIKNIKIFLFTPNKKSQNNLKKISVDLQYFFRSSSTKSSLNKKSDGCGWILNFPKIIFLFIGNFKGNIKLRLDDFAVEVTIRVQ